MIVLVIWLAASMLLVILSQPGSRHALHPQKQRPQVASLLSPQATARASLMS
jgi:hypothetical protein